MAKGDRSAGAGHSSRGFERLVNERPGASGGAPDTAGSLVARRLLGEAAEAVEHAPGTRPAFGGAAPPDAGEDDI